MAWDFGAEIHALSGFNADDGTNLTETGELYTLHANQWLTEGAKEIINLLPPKLKEKCAAVTHLYIGNTNVTMDMDSADEILYVTRENADAGHQTPCRELSAMNAALAADSTNMMHYASETDPVYYISSAAGASTLHVVPLPTAAQPAMIFHITYPAVAYTDTAIANFPNEVEHLVVLYAAIKATEYMMLFEEDQEVYGPQLTALKQDYQQGLSSIAGSPKGKDVR